MVAIAAVAGLGGAVAGCLRDFDTGRTYACEADRDCRSGHVCVFRADLQARVCADPSAADDGSGADGAPGPDGQPSGGSRQDAASSP